MNALQYEEAVSDLQLLDVSLRLNKLTELETEFISYLKETYASTIPMDVFEVLYAHATIVNNDEDDFSAVENQVMRLTDFWYALNDS